MACRLFATKSLFEPMMTCHKSYTKEHDSKKYVEINQFDKYIPEVIVCKFAAIFSEGGGRVWWLSGIGVGVMCASYSIISLTDHSFPCQRLNIPRKMNKQFFCCLLVCLWLHKIILWKILVNFLRRQVINGIKNTFGVLRHLVISCDAFPNELQDGLYLYCKQV